MTGVADLRPRATRVLAGIGALLLLSLLASAAAWGAAGHSARDEHPLGVLHPLLVHFPLALAMVSGLVVLLGLVFRDRFFRDALTFMITLAALFAVPAWLLGREAAASMGRMSTSREAVIGLHETWGTIAAASLLAAAALHGLGLRWPTSAVLRTLSRLSVLGAATAVSVAGYLGAEVVHGPDHLGGLLPWLTP